MLRTFTTLWNAIAIAAIGFTVWSGYQILQPPPLTPSVDRIDVEATIIEAVSHVNKQVFIEHYSGIEIRHIDAPEGWLAHFADRGLRQEFLMLVRGRVPAGIDLSQLSEDDIWVSADGKRAQLTLPAPKIFSENISVDLANSRIVESSDFCPGFICPDDRLANFQTIMEPEARKRLIRAAEEAGILKQAAADAERYYTQLLNGLGVAEVRVVVPGYTVASVKSETP